MTGSTLFVKLGNNCAMVKDRHSGNLLSEWLKDIDLSNFNSARDVCIAYFDHIKPDEYSLKSARNHVVFEFKCVSGNHAADTFDKMKLTAESLMEQDEHKWEEYLSDYSDHTWFVDLDALMAYRKGPPPEEPVQTHLYAR